MTAVLLSLRPFSSRFGSSVSKAAAAGLLVIRSRARAGLVNGGAHRLRSVAHPPGRRLRIPDVDQSFARSVAVIGSGIAGLTAAYVLSGRDRVTLFEADTRLGGHAHTHLVDRGDGTVVGVDSAFLVHNDRTYPTLCRLFADLGVATQGSEMSMSVRAGEGLEYAGARGLGGLFACRQSLRPRYLFMLTEIVRFHRAATRLLGSGTADGLETLDGFLHRHGFTRFFVEHFITPLVAAVWSCNADDALRYPARYLFVFLDHHGMLSVSGSPAWRTVTGGSRRYVQAVAARLHDVSPGTPVRWLRRRSDGVLLRAGDAAPRFFDAAVVAVHPDQALRVLDGPSRYERAVLGAIPYSTNRAQLHTDESVLPRHRRARAAWNYRIGAGSDPVMVTYDISRLMRIDADRRFLVTLGGHDRVDPESVLAEMTYSHPLYTPESVAAQRVLPTLDDDRVVFAGAYHGWGFHEDGAASGLRAARRLGADWPAPVRPTEAWSC
jgi:predicted NAD/FAD-binding protein